MQVLTRTRDEDDEHGSAAEPPAVEPPRETRPLAPAPPGPEQVVAHRIWCEARDRVLEAVLAGPSLVLVVGPPGTGKTLLLDHLARVLRAAGVNVLLQHRGDLEMAEARVEEIRAAQRRAVLIDEAARVNQGTLARLRQLGECAVVLAGVADPVPSAGAESSALAGVTVVRLGALPLDQVDAFVRSRLAQAGLPAGVLTDEAVAELAAHSGGIPRLLNILLGSALFLAGAEEAPRVEAAHVAEAVALRSGGLQDADEASPAAPEDGPSEPDGTPEISARVTPTLGTAGLPLGGAAPGDHRRGSRGRVLALAALCVAALALASGWLVWRHGTGTEEAAPPETATAPPAQPQATAAPASPNPPSPADSPSRAAATRPSEPTHEAAAPTSAPVGPAQPPPSVGASPVPSPVRAPLPAVATPPPTAASAPVPATAASAPSATAAPASASAARPEPGTELTLPELPPPPPQIAPAPESTAPHSVARRREPAVLRDASPARPGPLRPWVSGRNGPPTGGQGSASSASSQSGDNWSTLRERLERQVRAPSPPPPRRPPINLAEPPAPQPPSGYIGVYTTGADGTRVFRSGP